MVRTVGTYALCFLVFCAASTAEASMWRFDRPHLILEGSGLTNYSRLQLVQHTPEKDRTWAGITPEYPWEAAILFYTSLVGLPADFVSGAGADVHWHLYYPCTGEPLLPGNLYVCIAVSEDGETFTKPMFDILPYKMPNGSVVTTNRIFQTNTNSGPAFPHAQQGSVIITRRSGDASTNGSSASLALMVYEEQSKERHLLAAVSNDGVRFRNASGAGGGSYYVQGLPAYFADTEAAVLELGPDIAPLNQSANGYGGGCFAAYGRLDVFPGGVCPTTPDHTFRHAQAAYAVASNGSCSSGVALGPYHDARPTLDIDRGEDPAECLDVYNTAPQLLPGAVIALPSMYRHLPQSEAKAPEPAGSNDGVMDARLLVSRDGVSFRGITRKPFLPRGVGYRDPVSGWYNGTGSERDAGFVFVTVGGIMDDNTTPGRPSNPDLDEPDTPPLTPYVWILYWGTQTTHASGGVYLAGTFPGAFTGILRARLRREGFISLSTASDAEAGVARSVTLQVPQPEDVCGGGAGFRPGTAQFGLQLNIDAPNGGNATVALLDQAGNAYPGFGHADADVIRGNYVRAQVGWTQGTAFNSLAGRAMQIEIQLANADLYAWELVCQ